MAIDRSEVVRIVEAPGKGTAVHAAGLQNFITISASLTGFEEGSLAAVTRMTGAEIMIKNLWLVPILVGGLLLIGTAKLISRLRARKAG